VSLLLTNYKKTIIIIFTFVDTIAEPIKENGYQSF